MVIATIHQNVSAGATSKYVLSKSGASVIGGNAVAWVEHDALTQDQLAAHIETATAQLQQAIHLKSLARPVYHISLSLPPTEALDDAPLCTFAEQYLAGLILSAAQPQLLKQLSESEFQAAIEQFRDEELYKYCYTLVRHTDQPHPHVHIVLAKTNLETEKAIPTSHDRYRSQIVLRHLERQHGLAVQPHSWSVGRKAESAQQAQAEIKTGQPSVHKQLQIILDQAAAKSQTVPEFIQQAQAYGVEVRVQFTRTGKSKGISYSLDGVAMTGHALGTRYSFKDGDPGLVKHLGLSYEPERDRALIQALCQRPVGREPLPQINAPAPDPSLVLNHPERQALALQQQAVETAADDERPVLADNLEALPSQTDGIRIAAVAIPSIAPLSPLQPGQSDLELDLLPLVADASHQPTSLPTEAGLAAATTDLKQSSVLSQSASTDLPPPIPTPTVPAAPITDSSQSPSPLPAIEAIASKQRAEVSPRSTAIDPTSMSVQVEREESVREEPPNLEPLKLEPQWEAAQRQAWCQGMARIAHLGLQVTGRPHPESGNRIGQVRDGKHIYNLEWRQSDQTLIVRATDGRGVLMAQRGDAIQLSRTVTETDWHCFQRQEPDFLQQQAAAKWQRELWGRETAVVAKLAQKIVGKPAFEGLRYRITDDGQTLTLAATDGRGVLLRLRGDQIQVSERLTQADYDHFQGQLPALKDEWRRQLAEMAAQSQKSKHQSKNGKTQGGLGGIGG